MASNRGFVRKYSSSGEVLWTESNMLDQVKNSCKVSTFLVFVILQELATKNNCHSCRSGHRGDLRPVGGHGGGHHRHREDTLAGQPWPGGRWSSYWCSCWSTGWWTRKSWSHSLSLHDGYLDGNVYVDHCEEKLGYYLTAGAAKHWAQSSRNRSWWRRLFRLPFSGETET